MRVNVNFVLFVIIFWSSNLLVSDVQHNLLCFYKLYATLINASYILRLAGKSLIVRHSLLRL